MRRPVETDDYPKNMQVVCPDGRIGFVECYMESDGEGDLPGLLVRLKGYYQFYTLEELGLPKK